MNVLQYIVGSLILVLAIGLIVMIILQQGKRKGLENVIGGNSGGNSYLNKTEAAKKGKKFEKLTVWVAILFAVMVVGLYTITAINKNIEEKNASSSPETSETSQTAESSESTENSENAESEES
ncbi:MAG: preprotein translocase subunit SecG [Clostridia bacterium]|nr:preprotein translocase subunit SecG [Clostridia bacterium]